MSRPKGNSSAAVRKPRWVRATLETKRDTSLAVQEPPNATEFEIQAFIWSELRRLGINARGEVNAKFAGRATVRFDIAVFDDGELIGIIEVKDIPKNQHSRWLSTRQGRRYTQYGVPVRTIFGMTEATELVAQAQSGMLWQSLSIPRS